MRILVHEFASGGGLAGQRVPASLAREGLAMHAALLEDLAAIGEHQVVTTVDPRFHLSVPSGVGVVTLASGDRTIFDSLIASADGVWLIAPETDHCLERLAACVERKGKRLLGPGVAAIRRASDKAGLPRRLSRCGVRHPKTSVLRPGVDPRTAARAVGFPVVVKPGRGAGCRGVCFARNERELRAAVDAADRANGAGPLVLQHYVQGLAASVSLLADGWRAVPLAVNTQQMHAASRFSYRGGRTPLDHRMAATAVDAAVRTCRALRGLRGYVGVDVVLTNSAAVVIEVNPRLTTAYLGVRSALDANIAELALAACAGVLPEPPPVRRRVRFTAAGRIVSSIPYVPVPLRRGPVRSAKDLP